MCEANQRPDNSCIFLLGKHGMDEAAVDLDLIHFEISQVIEARVTSTEVIQGDPDACLAQATQNVLSCIKIAD
jgi:hypothetical protein